MVRDSKELPSTLLALPSRSKGFTLIELLVVIAIIAILSTVVVLALNPAELLKQSRDSTRLSDLSTMRSALSLYLIDVAPPTLASASSSCYTSATSSAACGGRHPGATYVTWVGNGTSARRDTDGNGWIGGNGNGTLKGPNFTAITSGSPIGQLPLDPLNTDNFYYSFAADTTSQTFEVDANMESSKFGNGGSGDVESTDGGTNADVYEAGTTLAL